MNEVEQVAFTSLQNQIKALEAQATSLAGNKKPTDDSLNNYDQAAALAAIKFKEDSELKDLEKKGNYDEALTAERNRFDAQINQEKEKVKSLNAQLTKTLENSAISTAISNAGGKHRALSALINSESLVRVVTEKDQLVARVFAKGGDTPRLNITTGESMKVDDLLKELAAEPELAGLFSASGNSGGGAQPSVGQSTGSVLASDSLVPFNGDTNLTEHYKSQLNK